MDYKKISKARHEVYVKSRCKYEVSDIVEEKDRCFFYTKDSSGATRVHLFSDSGAAIGLAEWGDMPKKSQSKKKGKK